MTERIAKAKLKVIEPRRPAQAIPGIYMLFVVDKAGVPSVTKQVRLAVAGGSGED